MKNWKQPLHMPSTLFRDFYWVSLVIWRRALHNWSGQDVVRCPHFIPSKRANTSSTLMPRIKLHIPFRLPLHPPQKQTSLIQPSSTERSMWVLQVPCVLYRIFMKGMGYWLILPPPVSCWCTQSAHRRTLPGVRSSYRLSHVARELRLSSHWEYR